MRIRTLELLRYGRFADKVLELPRSECDFHLVIGQNEAGKTTIRSAISELLFGFGHSSPYGYRFENAQLRIGAEIEGEAGELYLRRRKGRSQTLLDRAEKPLSEAALAAFRGQADRDFFERLFSLDQQGLVKGGRDIVEARNDLGRMLFQSAAGVGGFGDALKRLEDQADLLWGPRAADKRLYTRAERTLGQADKALKEATLRAPEYRDALAKRDEALEAAAKNNNKAGGLRTEEHKLRRIQTALPRLAERARLLAEIDAMGPVISLPEDAGQRLAAARSKLATADEVIRLVETSLAAKESEFHQLSADEGLIAKADEIERFRELRSQYRPYPADIAKRQVEVRSHQAQVERCARDLGWPIGSDDEFMARLPNRLLRSRLHALAQQHGGLGAAIASAKTALEKQRATNSEVETEHDRIPLSKPSAALSEALAAARRLGDARSRAESLQRAEQNSETETLAALRALAPWSGDAETLQALKIPSPAALGDLKARIELAQNSLRRAGDQAADRSQALASAELRVAQIQRDDSPVALEELTGARSARDCSWEAIKRGIQTNDLERARTEVVPFEASITLTDELSDRRFERAAQSADLTRSHHEVERLELEATTAKGKAADHAREYDGVLAELATMREGLGLPGKTIAELEEWIRAREAALGKLQTHDESLATLKAFQGELERATDGLRYALGAPAAPVGRSKPDILTALVGQAEGLLAEQQAHVQQRKAMQRQLERGRNEITTLESNLQQAEAEMAKWRADWSAACHFLSVDETLLPDQATAVLDLVRELEEALNAGSDIRTNRIGAMTRDLESFGEDVEMLARSIAPDLAGQPPSDIADTLSSRLQAAQRAAARRETLAKEIEEDRIRQKGAVTSRESATQSLRPLLEQAQVEDLEALSMAIERSAQYRALRADAARTERDLLEHGDGLSLTELVAEAGSQDRDRLLARLQEIKAILDDLGNERQRIGGDLQEAEARLRQMQGTDAASQAAEARQQALADMADAAQRWVRITVGVGLLRAAIDRYREAKQAPILKAAEQIFVKLTLRAFKALRIDYGQADHPVLLAVRHNDEEVPLEGLSTGTADQLFLALRIAALEEYLASSPPLPFIVDDLFVNFDDERAAAGFEVLGDLARRTQVIFLTHHTHLIAVTEGALADAAVPIQLQL